MAGHNTRHGLAEGRGRPLHMGTYAALAAGVLAVTGLAATLLALGAERETIRLAPVVATLPEREPETIASSAMVASMPGGFSVWPAVFVAQQAPWHLAGDAAGR